MHIRIAAGALAFALATGAAWAQSDTPPPPPPPGGPTAADGMAPPPPPSGTMREGPGRGDRLGPHDGMRVREGRGPRGGPRGWRHGPPAPPSKAAEFHLRRGPLNFRIRCAEEEPIKACADAALVLMDKFATVAGPTPPAASGAQPPAPSAP